MIPPSAWMYLGLLAATAAERGLELRLSARNVRWSLAQGGREDGFGHYPFMVVLHTGLLVGCAAETLWLGRGFVPAVGFTALGAVLATQALRWWCIATLGPRWNTRVIVVPDLPPVTDGPYRFVRHPNYLAVAVEGIALPMVHGNWITASVFTVLNAGLMFFRLRVENQALAGLPRPERA